MKFDFAKLSAFFLKAFLFTLPLGLQILLYKSNFFSGQFNYFSSAFAYLSELFLILAVVTQGLNLLITNGPKSKQEYEYGPAEYVWWTIFLLIIIANLVSCIFALDKSLALLGTLKWLELLGLIWLLARGTLPRDKVLKWLFAGAFLQVMVGLGQYLKQGDLGLTFLGESKLGASYLNVAKVDLAGEKVLRSYGTLPHPNLFGAYLLFVLMVLFQSLNRKKAVKYFPLIIFFAAGILLSFSRTVWIVGFLFCMFMILEKAIKFSWKQLIVAFLAVFFLLVVFSLDSVILARLMDLSKLAWQERIYFIEAAWNILKTQWWGVGEGNFVLEMGKFTLEYLDPWLYQPVHNFVLLAAAEGGIWLGALWVILFGWSFELCNLAMRRIIKSERFFWKAHVACLLCIILLGMTDHYFYTIWPGQAILGVYFGLMLFDFAERRKELEKV